LYANKLCTTWALLFYYLCIVKTVALILSFYFLLLNVVPCNDEDKSVNIYSDDISVQADCSFSNIQLNTCTSFCMCSCCNIHIIQSAEIFYELPFNEINSEIYFYTESLASKISFPLLHPPRA